MSIQVKLAGAWHRFVYFLRSWPKRILRFFSHFVNPPRFFFLRLRRRQTPEHIPKYRLGYWFLGAILLFLDLLGIPEFYETCMDFLKWNNQCLKEEEIVWAQKIFGDQLSYKIVRVDKKAFFGPRQWNIAYVSFFTINSWGELSMPVLMHELTHIWQYQHFGSVYIALALQAQMSSEGYDYGGVKQLVKQQDQPFHTAFSFEQQAEIIEDYYRSKNNLPLQWSTNGVIADHWLTYWVRKGLHIDSFQVG